ncbi:MAG: hypothetical protein P8Y47_13580, partial [Alphaproteobacteria bacterium]
AAFAYLRNTPFDVILARAALDCRYRLHTPPFQQVSATVYLHVFANDVVSDVFLQIKLQHVGD